jgi:hypothetical protein
MILLCTKVQYQIHWAYFPAGVVPLPSHLTSCRPTKSNLYLESSLESAGMEPALHKKLVFLVRNCISIFCRLCRLFKNSLQVRAPCESFVTWFFRWSLVSLTPARTGGPPLVVLSVAAYSIYSKLPTVAGGRPSICNPRTRHVVVKRGPT